MSASSIDRRGLLIGAIASVPAIGGAVAAPAPVEKEFSVQRVNRLAEELAHAMDDWMNDLAEPGHYAHWIAHVHPAGLVQHPVFFENSMRPSPDRELVRLGMQLDEAWAA